jgi:glycosyltransferase involved in cell wall biosynthesis
MMRVLVLNHTGVIGGGERSLVELLEGVREAASVEVACPAGPLAEATRKLGLQVHEIHGTSVSFRLHPMQTARGVAQLGAATLDVRRALSGGRFDLIHANSTRSGLIAAPLTLYRSPPLVVHVRDSLPSGGLASLTRRAIDAAATIVLANSEYTARSFASNGTYPWSGRRPPLRVVHNAVDVSRFDPSRVDRRQARLQLGLSPDDAAIGVIGQITPWKAQDDAIRTLAELHRRGVGARLLVVGQPAFAAGTERYDNEAFLASLHRLVAELELTGSVLFLGERDDVPEVLGALDLLLVPSWEEPFGRVVVEAMSMAVPVMATDVGGPAEIILDGDDGILLPPRRPARWGEVAFGLLSDPERRAALGHRARATAHARFTPEQHVAAVLAAYREAMSR